MFNLPPTSALASRAWFVWTVNHPRPNPCTTPSLLPLSSVDGAVLISIIQQHWLYCSLPSTHPRYYPLLLTWRRSSFIPAIFFTANNNSIYHNSFEYFVCCLRHMLAPGGTPSCALGELSSLYIFVEWLLCNISMAATIVVVFPQEKIFDNCPQRTFQFYSYSVLCLMMYFSQTLTVCI